MDHPRRRREKRRQHIVLRVRLGSRRRRMNRHLSNLRFKSFDDSLGQARFCVSLNNAAAPRILQTGSLMEIGVNLCPVVD